MKRNDKQPLCLEAFIAQYYRPVSICSENTVGTYYQSHYSHKILNFQQVKAEYDTYISLINQSDLTNNQEV